MKKLVVATVLLNLLTITPFAYSDSLTSMETQVVSNLKAMQGEVGSLSHQELEELNNGLIKMLREHKAHHSSGAHHSSRAQERSLEIRGFKQAVSSSSLSSKQKLRVTSELSQHGLKSAAIMFEMLRRVEEATKYIKTAITNVFKKNAKQFTTAKEQTLGIQKAVNHAIHKFGVEGHEFNITVLGKKYSLKYKKISS